MKNYKYVHIYSEATSTAVANIRLLKKMEEDTETAYIICKKKLALPEDLINEDNIFDLSKNQNNLTFIPWIRCADKVFFHFFKHSNKIIVELLTHPKLLKKCIWIEWGGDLYEWTFTGGSFKTKIANIIRRHLLKSFKKVVCIFEPDVKFYKETLKGRGEVIVCPYYTSVPAVDDFELKNRAAVKEFAPNKAVNILIGHRATQNLEHIKVLDDIAKYATENVQIHLPLSYGEGDYADRVMNHAVDIFGEDRVTQYRDFMPYADYCQLMKKIDIAILYSNRQIALGNIKLLLYANAKVFLQENSPLYDYFSSMGVDVYAEDKISSMTFEEFCHPADTQTYQIYYDFCSLSDEEKGSRWRRVLNF